MYIRILGSTAFMLFPREQRNKFEPNTTKCVHVGYFETQKAFRFWGPEAEKIRISRDVFFNEVVSQPCSGRLSESPPRIPTPDPFKDGENPVECI